ncbi:succinate dehydrogenase assembly factor 2, mitochondrial-like [Portunus trituberculatus]|uniref:Succinate dehydrogenase assembly factor 2, mitochondrial n=1 Tax=Portunus trituberculatus TaxID=210409 RepID=A0A5B7D6J0_PORTR|nr:succinate dehydrogenase assembly factor 2, mitochondrial-like [Portunus trituberculatus]MPC16885.1 Succinate dehydrogenase assembly factor 2, mitochondrial [Portunus trituberculatus]
MALSWSFSLRHVQRFVTRTSCLPALTRAWYSDKGDMHPAPPEIQEPTIPPYEEKVGEPVHLKRARLQYQSRKRGMLENGLILSSFAHRFLPSMTENQLALYDRLINLPSNDWEIYYWATGVQPTPQEFDNEVMTMLKEFVKNSDRENRTIQPNLH